MSMEDKIKGVHLSHCNQGEYIGQCKYGDEADCPAFEPVIPESQTPEDSERIYPCADCGKLRSKDEGGTTFTVCAECWDKRYKKLPESAKLTLFHINWGDGDNSYIVASNETEAIKKMPDGKDMVNYVVQLDALYNLIYEQGRRDVLDKMELERCDPDVMPYFEDYYWLQESEWQSLKGES